MRINFVGNYQSGYVGEQADEVHLARSLEQLGHQVQRIPRDEWREFVIEKFPQGKYPNIPKHLHEADINIIGKWHHFYDETFITALRDLSQAPVFYWVWDYMYDGGFPDWHLKAVKTADLYLSGEQGIEWQYRKEGVTNFYYFQMDVCDAKIPVYEFREKEKEHDVIFTGTYLGQGDRIDWLKRINEQCPFPLKIYSWNHEEWRKQGFKAFPAIYGTDYNREIALSRVVLGFSVNPNCWGYWSNRVGKVTRAGGFLLQQYAPGMEQFVGPNVEFFSSPDEAVEKIKYFVENPEERNARIKSSNQNRFTSLSKMAQLAIVMERYLKTQVGHPQTWNSLP